MFHLDTHGIKRVNDEMLLKKKKNQSVLFRGSFYSQVRARTLEAVGERVSSEREGEGKGGEREGEGGEREAEKNGKRYLQAVRWWSPTEDRAKDA